MARNYQRDSQGRFSGSGGRSSGGSGGASKGGNKGGPLPPPPKAATKNGANAIKPGPRRLNAAEKAYLEIKAQKSKFGSDKKVIAEMARRGFLKGPDPQGQAIRIASSARRKKGSPY